MRGSEYISHSYTEHTDGNQKEAATIAGISRNTLRNKLIKYDINTSKSKIRAIIA